MVLWVVVPCSVVVGYQRFGELKMETAQCSKMLVSNHHTTWCNNLENHEFCLHCHENLTFYIKDTVHGIENVKQVLELKYNSWILWINDASGAL
jgi:hypothetical protein